MREADIKKYFSEFIATFFLVFIGTGAVAVSATGGTQIGLIGVAFTFGIAIFVLVNMFGKISGANMNPAVTLALYVSRKITLSDALFYIVMQCAGAICASMLICHLLPETPTFGETLPSITKERAIFVESIATFFIMFAIVLSFRNQDLENKLPSVLGAIVFLDIMVFGPLTGASMNPARTLGPAIVSGNYTDISIYIIGPIFGALLAVFVGYILHPRNHD